ncbi:MAG: class I SAM-dependent methyltransferase [Ignavibacteriales bacterium]|nr:class I SAM-dependent methyltransferase [Ignavibacteriales bacterium]
MPEKKAIDLGSVQKTLLLPLWGRAVETRKQKPLLVDTAAVQIIEKINYDFSTITNNMSEITRLAWIVRCLHVDRTIKQFLLRHPRATIVNIGCGLDTTLSRIDNGNLRWYNLDLPDVIELRRSLIPEPRRSECIAASFLDESWLHHVKVDDAILFIAVGVFYYFNEAEMKKFFVRLADKFPLGELIFDEASPLGVMVANKKVIEAGGMDKTAFLKWGIETAKHIQTWDKRITLIDEYPMFKGMKKRLSLRNKYGTFLSDRLKIMSMVHLKFSN